ncbi:hypothetical protein SLS53_008622 [Cytospora paraplurivora]|uniref:Cytochrome P450 n=1 Tax=Cytospora paraplurivora TaxID=2898453 RepID=A0AAN9TYK8_9PEZI
MNTTTEGQPRFLTVGNIVAGILFSTVISILLTWHRAPRYAEDIPWVGTGKGFLAGFQQMKNWVRDGYETYSKKGQTFILPGLLGTPPEVVIPRSQMGWMLDQPDHIISTAAAHYDILNGRYSFVDSTILENPYQEHVVHRSLQRHLNALIPEIDEQIRICVDDIYGTDENEWCKVNIWDSLMKLIPRVTNRMLVGRPLCDNPEYIDNMVNFTLDVTRDLMAFPMVPTIIKPILGPLAGLATKYHYRKTAKHSLPLIRERLHHIRRKEAGDVAYRDWTAPNDYLTWTISIAVAEGCAAELDPVRISKRLLPLNYAAIDTTVITTIHALLDILCYDKEQGIVNSLREEAERVLNEEPVGRWNKVKLASLHRIDSAIRESMRVNAMSQTMVIRKVIAPGGVTNENTGQHFSAGTMLSCPIWCTQHDEDIYGGEADRFDAFRYSRQIEEYNGKPAITKNPGDGLKIARMGMVTTSVEHCGFGHGRHACPGRFFVAHELKMLISYLLLNYEFKDLGERPATKWIGKFAIPPTGATMELKRKRGTSIAA